VASTEFKFLGKTIFSVERRDASGFSTLQNPTDWLINALGGAMAATGENVTPEMAMTVPAFIGCVKVIAETLAMQPVNIIQANEDGTKVFAFDDPAHQLIHFRPNANMNTYVWREAMQSNACVHGNAYSLIRRDAMARPVELEFIQNPRTVTPFMFQNKLFYKVNGMADVVACDDMFHIPGLVMADENQYMNGVTGRSPVYILKNVLGLALAVEKYGGLVFNNGGSQRTAFKSPGKVDEVIQSKIKKQWAEKYGTAARSHEPAFLQGGLDVVTIGINPVDAQMVELKKYLNEEIARVMRVQLHLIQSLDKATNNNIEKQSREFVDFTMMPWLVKWEMEINNKLISYKDRGRKYAKFNMNSLLRGDIKTRGDWYWRMIQGGVYSPNDVLAKEDENARPGGDIYLTPQNMITNQELEEKINDLKNNDANDQND
jgi:HK97 family phage portal protein